MHVLTTANFAKMSVREKDTFFVRLWTHYKQGVITSPSPAIANFSHMDTTEIGKREKDHPIPSSPLDESAP